MTTAITIIGLGPGHRDDLTLAAQACFAEAEQAGTPVYFRTYIHPTVEPLRQVFPKLRCDSFDNFYEESDDWSTLYQHMAQRICELAAQQPLLYAVPGHPLIAEASVQLILQVARERGLTTRIVSGLSFLEPVCEALQLDPYGQGLQLIDATELAALRPDEIAGKVVPTAPLLVAQVYNRRLASAVKLALGECYPDEWRVRLVRAAGNEGDEQVSEMPLYELDRNNFANHLTTLYVPPVDELAALRLPETLRYITYRLRREPDGCPWDRQHTHQSLTRYVLEEAYEVVEALEENNMDKLAEELGDLALQVYLHAEIARQAGEFTLGDVFEHVNAKLIRRHPHVFGTVEVKDVDQVLTELGRHQTPGTRRRRNRCAAGEHPRPRAARHARSNDGAGIPETRGQGRLRLSEPAGHPDQTFRRTARTGGSQYARTSLRGNGRCAFHHRPHRAPARHRRGRSPSSGQPQVQAPLSGHGAHCPLPGSRPDQYTSPEWSALWKEAKNDGRVNVDN